jgi:DNA ligase-associated metallophosphoesterase
MANHSFTTHQIRGQHLRLLADKCIFWEEEQALILSDLHLGKTQHFRKHGIQAPLSIISGEILRLERIFTQHSPKKVYIVGDLFHSDVNSEWSVFEQFVSQHAHSQWYLIRGNHDIMPTFLLSSNHIKSATLLVDGPFLFSHQPQIHHELYVISGHKHPGVVLRGKGRQTVKMPCFYFSQNFALLPAFGNFTGLDTIQPTVGDAVFGITQTHVILLNQQ